jgi:hypothetical protein
LKSLEQKDKELFDWMNNSQKENVPIIYVTLGSECRWQEWSVKEIYLGLKAINCRVIWGLKPEFKLPEENDRFWVRPWLP